MFDFIGGIVEALAGYTAGRFQSRKYASHLSAIVVSLICGVIFFVGYGIYELFFPAPNGNGLKGLFIFSFGISFVVYLLVIIDFWLKKKKNEINDFKGK